MTGEVLKRLGLHGAAPIIGCVSSEKANGGLLRQIHFGWGQGGAFVAYEGMRTPLALFLIAPPDRMGARTRARAGSYLRADLMKYAIRKTPVHASAIDGALGGNHL